MRFDITRGHALGVHRQDLFLNVLTDTGLVLLQDLGLKFAFPITRYGHFHIAKAGPQCFAAVTVAAVVRVLIFVVIKILLNRTRIGLRFGFSCRARKAQASRFGTKTQLAGRTLTPMPPAGGELTGELRHKPETHVGAAVCSAAWGASCRCVRFCRPTTHPCRSVPRKRRVRPPWRREEN